MLRLLAAALVPLICSLATAAADHPPFDPAFEAIDPPPAWRLGSIAKGAETGTISGRVTDSTTGQPLELVFVDALNLEDFAGYSVATDADGRYELPVPVGDYRVAFRAGDPETGELNGPYVREQYSPAREGSFVSCDSRLNCLPTVDTPVTVTTAGVAGINASLDPGVRFSGRITDALGNPPDAGSIRIEFFDPQGRYISTAFQTRGFGNWETWLPPGSYVLVASTATGLGYIDETHNDTPCPRGSCDFSAEAPLTLVNQGDTRDDIDFVLDQGAIIIGAIREKGTGNLIGDGWARVYTTEGRYAAFARMSGEIFFTRTGLPDGTYFVSTTFQDSRFTRTPVFEGIGLLFDTGIPYIDVLLGGAQCLGGCDVLAGTPVTIAGGVVVNGELLLETEIGGTITGEVIAATDQTVVDGAGVQVYDGTGAVISRATSRRDGSYITGPFPAGDYRVASDAADKGFVDQIFSGLDCGGDCSSRILEGETLTVATGGETGGTLLALRTIQVVTADDVAALDESGRAVVVCANRLFVGAPGDDEAGPDAGAVLEYDREGQGFIFREKRFAPEPENGDGFGAALACDGNSLVIGAPGAGELAKGGGGGNKPAAYLLTLGSDTTELRTILADNLGSGESDNGAMSFGSSVAIDGDTMVVGAPEEDGSGAAVVFFGANFTQQAILQDPAGAPGDGLGAAVAITGGSVAAGAPNQALKGIASGAVQLFESIGGAEWTSVGKFTNDEAAVGDAFGTSIVVDGNALAVGAPGSDLAGQTDAGAAHIFSFDGDTVIQTSVLVAGDAVAGARLGDALAIEGDLLLAGAPRANGESLTAGAAYLFQQEGGSWTDVQKFSSADGEAGDGFGTAVGFDGSQIAVGAPDADTTGLTTVFGNAEVVFTSGFD